MASKAKLNKFSGRYDSFLSDASNEEIVSISKELTDEMASQVRLVNNSGIALIGISLFLMSMSILLFSTSTSTFSGTSRSIILVLRVLALALMCVSAAMGAMAVVKSVNASSVSTMFWRNVRETADDEKVYEQMMAIRSLNFLISASKNNLKSSVMYLIVGGICVGLAYLYELLLAAGYI
ncbi:MAG: hypothetical protein MJZ21_02935 [archaeon]|nr:hypothetical protein [archaeon]